MSKYNTVCKLTARWVKPHSVYVHVIHVLQELFRANYNGVRSILPCWASVCVCVRLGEVVQFRIERCSLWITCMHMITLLYIFPIGCWIEWRWPGKWCTITIIVVSRVSTHGRQDMHVIRDFGPHGCLLGIHFYGTCYLDMQWVLTRDATLL